MFATLRLTPANKLLLPILFINFIGTLGISLVMPFLVFLVNKFGGNEIIYGIVGASYSFFQFIGAPILGRWSDQFGRKKILFLSQAGTLLSWIIFLVALYLPNVILYEDRYGFLGHAVLTVPLIVLFISRALDGLTGGNISVANAYLVDISTDKDRNQNFGKMAASSNLGFVIGPVLAGVLGATFLAEKLPVASAILISLVGLILIHTSLEDHQTQTIEKSPCRKSLKKTLGLEPHCSYESKVVKPILSDTLKLPIIKPMLILYFFIFLAFNIFYAAFPIHAVESLHWDIWKLGLYFSFLSGSMVFVQGPVLTKMTKIFCEEKLVAMGLGLLTISFLLLITNSLLAVYTSALFFAMGNGLMWPSFLSIIGKIGDKKQQGTIQGFSTSMGSMASILGLVSGGYIYSYMGNQTFVVGSTIFFGVLIFSLIFLGTGSPMNQNSN